MSAQRRSPDETSTCNEPGLPRLLLIAEVASILRLSKAAVYQLVKGGQLRALRIRSRTNSADSDGALPERWTYRVDELDLKAFITGRRTTDTNTR